MSTKQVEFFNVEVACIEKKKLMEIRYTVSVMEDPELKKHGNFFMQTYNCSMTLNDIRRMIEQREGIKSKVESFADGDYK